MTPDTARTNRATALRHAAILLGVCALLYLPFLGQGGLTDTEGHRAIPAYEMLDRGSYVVPTLFERPYLRKPPAIQWAIASTSALLGRTELAARLPSAIGATLTALGAFCFAWRWFGLTRQGVPIALGAGLAFALLPWFWPSNRSAEIEALNNLATALAAWLILDRLVLARARTARSETRCALAIGAATALMLLAKGPAGAPTIAGAIVASVLVRRSWRVLGSASVWGGLLLGGLAFGVWALLADRSLASWPEGGPPTVRQGPGAFMFEDGLDAGQLLRVLGMAPSALLFALPASFALLFPWGPDAKAEAASDERDESGTSAHERWMLARAIALSALVGLAILTLMGVDNPRYALPVMVVIPPAVGALLRGLADTRAGDGAGLTPKRAAIARWMLLRLPRPIGSGWVVVLVGLGLAHPHILESGVRATSGRAAGEALAESISNLNVVPERLYADGLIEARPETLWYAEQRLNAQGVRPPRVLWWPLSSLEPRDPVLVARRTDPDSPESATPIVSGGEAIHHGEVHKFSYVLELWTGKQD